MEASEERVVAKRVRARTGVGGRHGSESISGLLARLSAGRCGLSSGLEFKSYNILVADKVDGVTSPPAPAREMVAIRMFRLVLAALFTIAMALASTAEAKKEVPQVLCEACRATLTELRASVEKTAKKLGRSNAVTEAMEALCEDMYNFRSYAYPPPQMQKGCRTIMDRHEEEIESALWRGDENVVDDICSKPKGACHGVDMSEEAMNAKPMEVVKDWEDDEL